MYIKLFTEKFIMGIGDWGLGIGDWGLGIGDWAQSPIPIATPYIVLNNKWGIIYNNLYS